MITIGILLFDDVELLDFAGPYEVFSVTNELNNYQLFNIFTISENGEMIKTINGLKVLPDYSINDCPSIDILALPGGDGTKRVIANKSLMKWIFEANKRSEITFSVCSGARIPAKLGLLDNKRFTTHHAVIDDVLKIAPEAIFKKKKRYIDNGKIMTAAGISAGIDLALHIVEKVCGKSAKEQTVAYMEYIEKK